MRMPLKRPYALPSLLKIPQFNCHIITGRQHIRQRRVHGDTADVVWVRLEVGDFLRGVVVEDAELEVVAAADDPVLAGDEAASAHGDVGQLEGLDDAA